MMMIWEETYLRLYSSRAIAAGPAYLSSQVSGLMHLLSKWHEQHSGVMETIVRQTSIAESFNGSSTQYDTCGHDADDLVPAQLELRYCCHVTHVLILRCERSNDDQAKARMRYHARTCLRLIAEIGNIGDGTLPTPNRLAKARLALLSRVLGNYPMVAFMDLATFRLDEFISGLPGSDAADFEFQTVDADIELLCRVCTMSTVQIPTSTVFGRDWDGLRRSSTRRETPGRWGRSLETCL